MIYVFNGFIAIYAVFLAITGDEVLKAGNAVGTSSNQVLLGMLVVVLIIVVIYLGRKQDKANKASEDRQMKLDAKIDAERAAFGEERRNRIDALMKMVTENAVALNRTASAEMAMCASTDAMRIAILSNTKVTEGLYEFLKRQNGRST